MSISAVDYAAVTKSVLDAARARVALGVSALAVHGVMTGHDDPMHRARLNSLHILTPDGQPVRWALKWIHGIDLPDRVYGPTLTRHVLKGAEQEKLSVCFYGSSEETLTALISNVTRQYPDLVIAAYESSKFRRVTPEEQGEIVERIKNSGASIVFVGLGCPRQEVWAYENLEALGVPILAVGAAFDFLGGVLPQAPKFLQDRGLEWAYRLFHEPRRLWRRYLLLSPRFLWYVLLQKLRLRNYPEVSDVGSIERELYG